MKRLLSICLVLGILGGAREAHAVPHVTITKGQIQAMPIAIMDFYADPSADGQLAQQIPQVITADLASSGMFAPIAKSAFIQDPISVHNAPPHFADWKSIDAQALVSGAISRTADGRTRVEFRLWDVYGGSQMAGTAYTTNGDNWRRIAHIISDEIYKRVTGDAGYFDSRIVYIAESGPANDRQKRLAIMDQDGFNQHYLTDGKALVLTPRFSPNQQMIAYMAYYGNKPRVYLYNLDTGHQEMLGDFPHMTFSPRFSHDGHKVVFSQTANGNSNIFVMDLATRHSTQLTSGSSLNTSPCFSPDDKSVVFESDRSGGQQLYVMPANGGEAHRITFGQGHYASPVWSPRGDQIAFTRVYQNQFYIGVIKPDGSGEREITNAYDVEGPTWAPNGRVLAYFKSSANGGHSRIETIDLTGYNQRELPTEGDASDPAWSPINP